MFARLTSPEPLVYAMPTLTKERAAESSRVVETPTKAPIVPKAKEAEDNGSPAGVEAGDATIANTSRGDLESQYLSKALEYFISVPTMEGSQVGLIQSIASGFQPSISADKLKCEIVKATMSYLNTLPKDSSSGPVDYDLVEKALNDSKGNFLHLCALFVNEQLLAIETLDHVVGLCKAVIRVLPGDEKAKAEPEKPVTNDPMDKMPAWPSQEKRENGKYAILLAPYQRLAFGSTDDLPTLDFRPSALSPALSPAVSKFIQANHDSVPGCRTVILKGVGHVTNINQLQSLVWGGRLESIHLPEPGKESAMVKFLTPEGCQRYFDATENGIEIPGDKTKSLIFVERNSAPNSINDVLRNCTEGDATRCVRALDADDDWSDMVLLKLARGQGKVKREIDRIKRGRTNKGVRSHRPDLPLAHLNLLVPS